MCTSGICRPSVGRYIGRVSVAIFRLRLGRLSVDMNRQACRPTPGRYFTATRPIIYRHSAVSSCCRRSSIFPALLKEAFSGRHPFLPFNSGNIHVFFPAMFFPRHRFYIRPSLLSDAAAFGDCCFWSLIILGEQKMI